MVLVVVVTLLACTLRTGTTSSNLETREKEEKKKKLYNIIDACSETIGANFRKTKKGFEFMTGRLAARQIRPSTDE